jgi:predicted nucleotidyltransferase
MVGTRPIFRLAAYRALTIGFVSGERVAPDLTQDQVDAALAVLNQALEPGTIIGVYLYGSAVAGGLRPDSDLDLFVVTTRRLSRVEKRRLVDGLLPISGRDSRPSEWRPLEVTVVALPDVRPWHYPPRWELQFGEWLRQEFLDGELKPWPDENPDLGVLVTMVRLTGKALVGPPPTEVLDAVPHRDLVRAMTDGLPQLIGDLEADTRNVLLTLARIWCTLVTGEIRSKHEAADWALGQLPAEHRAVLERARDLYLAGGYGSWGDMEAVRSLADHVVSEARRLASD